MASQEDTVIAGIIGVIETQFHLAPKVAENHTPNPGAFNKQSRILLAHALKDYAASYQKNDSRFNLVPTVFGKEEQRLLGIELTRILPFTYYTKKNLLSRKGKYRIDVRHDEPLNAVISIAFTGLLDDLKEKYTHTYSARLSGAENIEDLLALVRRMRCYIPSTAHNIIAVLKQAVHDADKEAYRKAYNDDDKNALADAELRLENYGKFEGKENEVLAFKNTAKEPPSSAKENPLPQPSAERAPETKTSLTGYKKSYSAGHDEENARIPFRGRRMYWYALPAAHKVMVGFKQSYLGMASEEYVVIAGIIDVIETQLHSAPKTADNDNSHTISLNKQSRTLLTNTLKDYAVSYRKKDSRFNLVPTVFGEEEQRLLGIALNRILPLTYYKKKTLFYSKVKCRIDVQLDAIIDETFTGVLNGLKEEYSAMYSARLSGADNAEDLLALVRRMRCYIPSTAHSVIAALKQAVHDADKEAYRRAYNDSNNDALANAELRLENYARFENKEKEVQAFKDKTKAPPSTTEKNSVPQLSVKKRAEEKPSPIARPMGREPRPESAENIAYHNAKLQELGKKYLYISQLMQHSPQQAAILKARFQQVFGDSSATHQRIIAEAKQLAAQTTRWNNTPVPSLYGGIGIEATMHKGKGLLINQVFAGSRLGGHTPAHKKGLKVSDLITHVKQGDVWIDIRNATAEHATALVRGDIGKPVALQIIRNGKPLHDGDTLGITLIRNLINAEEHCTHDFMQAFCKQHPQFREVPSVASHAR